MIDSGEFSSLHPGTTSSSAGSTPTERAALQGVEAPQNLYPAAYIRQISR